MGKKKQNKKSVAILSEANRETLDDELSDGDDYAAPSDVKRADWLDSDESEHSDSMQRDSSSSDGDEQSDEASSSSGSSLQDEHDLEARAARLQRREQRAREALRDASVVEGDADQSIGDAEAAAEEAMLFEATHGSVDNAQVDADEAEARTFSMSVGAVEAKRRVDQLLYVLASFKERRGTHRASKARAVADNDDDGEARVRVPSRRHYVMALEAGVCALYGCSVFYARLALQLFSAHEAVAFIEAASRPRPLCIRVNTLLTRRRDVAEALIARGANVDPVGAWAPHALLVHAAPVPVGATPEYLAGHYMLQGAASMLPVLALRVHASPHLRVLDMCAAPGGKATHVAALMRNQGVLYCNDASAPRLAAVKGNVARMQVRNAVLLNYSGTELLQVLGARSIDLVLLDAPCSGLGVAARDPLVAVQRSAKDVQRCALLQKQLLLAAFDLLKRGGALVYSTCSVAVEENECVVAYLLQKRVAARIEPLHVPLGAAAFTRYRHHRFVPQMAEARRFYPHQHNMDGFFVCRIAKVGVADSSARRATKEGVVKVAVDVAIGANGRAAPPNGPERSGKKRERGGEREAKESGGGGGGGGEHQERVEEAGSKRRRASASSGEREASAERKKGKKAGKKAKKAASEEAGERRAAEGGQGGVARAERQKRAQASTATKTSADSEVGMVQVQAADAEFEASARYRGARVGYVFKKGARGVGYYRDAPPPKRSARELEALLGVAHKNRERGGERERERGGAGRGARKRAKWGGAAAQARNKRRRT